MYQFVTFPENFSKSSIVLPSADFLKRINSTQFNSGGVTSHQMTSRNSASASPPSPPVLSVPCSSKKSEMKMEIETARSVPSSTSVASLMNHRYDKIRATVPSETAVPTKVEFPRKRQRNEDMNHISNKYQKEVILIGHYKF